MSYIIYDIYFKPYILGGTGSNPVVAKPEIFHFSYFCNFLYRCSHEDHFVYKFVVPEASFRSELINSIRLYFFLALGSL